MKSLTSAFVLLLLGISGGLVYTTISIEPEEELSGRVLRAHVLDALTPISESDTDPISDRIARMTIDEKISEMLMIGYPGSDSDTILTEMVVGGKVGGVMLMGSNVKDGKDVKALTESLKEKSGIQGVFIAIDQEGGDVKRLMGQDILTLPQSSMDTVLEAYDSAHKRGKLLKELGISVNFSPIVDYITNEESFLYDRAFRGTKKEVGEKGAAMIEGYRDAGIVGAVKHFPGHADDSVDSHDDLPDLILAKDFLDDHASPFFELFGHTEVDMIMMGHIMYRELDPDYPASLSDFFVRRLIHSTLGMNDTVVITDDLTMGALTKNYMFEDIIVSAVRAGNDILLFVGEPALIDNARLVIHTALESQSILPEWIDERVYRILSLKQKLGLLK